MHKFLVKRPVVDDGMPKSRKKRNATKDVSNDRKTTLKSVTAEHNHQCTKVKSNAHQKSSGFKNPFSLAAPKASSSTKTSRPPSSLQPTLQATHQSSVHSTSTEATKLSLCVLTSGKKGEDEAQSGILGSTMSSSSLGKISSFFPEKNLAIVHKNDDSSSSSGISPSSAFLANELVSPLSGPSTSLEATSATPEGIAEDELAVSMGDDDEGGAAEEQRTVAPPPFTPCVIPNLPAQEGNTSNVDRKAVSFSGVIRNNISPFTQNPKYFSQGARFALGLSDSRLASLVGRKMQAVASPAAAVELLNSPRETRFGPAVRSGCVTCIKFDSGGVLCAVGGSNGVLRVYDFDEVTFSCQLAANVEIVCEPEGEGPSVRVHPMVYFTGPSRDISDLCWLPPSCAEEEEEEEEVAVAFTHYPAIHIYDLNTLSRTQCLVPSQGRSGGNCCVICLPPSCPPSSSKLQPQVTKVLAGGENGLLRYWKVSPQAGVGQAGDIKATWEVLADPLSTAGPHCAVVSILQSPHASSIITTVTRMGIVVQWDLGKLSVQSFSTNATPVSIRRIELVSLSIGPWQVAGAAFCRRGAGKCPRDSDTGDSLLCVTAKGGHVRTYDLVEPKLLESVDCTVSSTLPTSFSTAPGAAASTDDSSTAMDGNITLEAPPALHCPIGFSTATGSQVFYTGSPKSNHLDIMRLGGSSALLSELPRDHFCRQQLVTLQQQHLRYASAMSYLEALHPVFLTDQRGGSSYERHVSQQLATLSLSAPAMMQRTKRVSHTLPGHVLLATPGCTRVVTSRDLSAHLCATGQENRSGGMVDSQRSISGMLDGNKSSVVHIRSGTGDKTDNTSCYTIDAIFGCEISLDRPYRGLAITEGHPKASLCTNLRPKLPPATVVDKLLQSFKTPDEVRAHLRGKEPTGSCGELLAHIPLSARATAIQPHPCCPYVVVGCMDDSVVVLSPEGC